MTCHKLLRPPLSPRTLMTLALPFQFQYISQLNEAINVDLKSLDLRMHGNKLSLNVSKTPSMLFGTKPKHQELKTAGS